MTPPVVLVLPAHNEEASVAAVVRRAPATVHGRPVVVLVVDDGSTDRTVERASAAGALVIGHVTRRGLGAAVRTGLRAATDRGAAAVAFCDADGEYAPEELDRVVAPVLEGRVHYVVGSRFSGSIERMLPHRRVGNRLLTAALRLVTGVAVTDGQSGYRALSETAARSTEIAHDYNYAQVLTIEMLQKGFGYSEVPISYRWRDHGRSFVRPATYLSRVVPTVWRMLRVSPAPRARGTVHAPRPTL